MVALSERGVSMSFLQSLETIFFAAASLDSAAERERYLETACAGDEALLCRARKMIDAQAVARDFLEEPAVLSDAALGRAGEAERSGAQIGPYRLIEPIGEGGMGTVWLAEQTAPMSRLVALKLIRPGLDSSQNLARFEAERRALGYMDHPNIARVLDADATEGGVPYFVMELVRGTPITRHCDEQRLSLQRRLKLFVPVCWAIQHAHHKGVIHRDIKPDNVLITVVDGSAVPKVIDFGVAKPIEEPQVGSTPLTRHGVLVGTLEYMSPEQAQVGATSVDTRSDVYALGALLHELLTGDTPFGGERFASASLSEVLRIIREEEPRHPGERLRERRDLLVAASELRDVEPTRLLRLLRGELGWIVMKALERDPARRYQSARALADDVERHLRDEPVEARPPSMSYRLRKLVIRRRRSSLVLAGAALLTASVVCSAWLYRKWHAEAERGREQVARSERVATTSSRLREVRAALDRGQRWAAFELLEPLLPELAEDAAVRELLEQCSEVCSLSTTPSGADVWIRPYEEPEAPWRLVARRVEGTSAARIARGEHLWRASMAGFHDVVGLRASSAARFTLERVESTPGEMVRVDAGRSQRPELARTVDFHSVDLGPFLIDRHEVTNSEYLRFVEAGGYEQPSYWRDLPFIDPAGAPTTWESVQPLLVDRTGRAGPATWSDGTFARGAGDLPVGGLSWYEAMAYARYAGKLLPSIHHWLQAAQITRSVSLAGDAYIARFNLGSSVKPVSALRDYGLFGAVGMAGNVREWCFNATETGARFTLGGTCGDPTYAPLILDSAHPLQRGALNGVRCVATSGAADIPDAAWSPVASIPWPPAPERGELLDSRAFDLVVRDRFRYAAGAPLDQVSTSEHEPGWTHVTARINAAYHDAAGRCERLTVHLYLPEVPAGPAGHQAIVYSPAADGRMLPRVRPLPDEYGLDALVRSGRAVVIPVYQGTYERRLTAPLLDERALEDLRLCVGLDLKRTVDYLELRGDIDMLRLGYYGYSLGAEWAGSLVAVEPRLRAIVFEAGGLPPEPLRKDHPFLEWRHCLPQIQAPLLMINGEADPVYPVEASQRPMFALIGSADKEHYVHPAGHHALSPEVKFAHVLPWLDRTLGRPVASRENDR